MSREGQIETLDDHWRYNVEDCCRTLECADEELSIIEKFNLQSPHAFEQSMFYPVLQAMCTGVRIDLAERERLSKVLDTEMKNRLSLLKDLLGHNLNPRSPTQLSKLFYNDLNQKIVIKRSTGNPTTDDDALTLIGNREPLLRPVVRAIQEYRSLGVFRSTFVEAPLDVDQRMRCSYNICGTETLRLSSAANAFDTGTNLQNVPKGRDEDGLSLPNVRSLFIPDEGHTFFDLDLDRADLYVVVWEADDRDLKLAMTAGLDMHLFNALAIFNIKGIPPDELKESHPNYKDHRKRIGNDKRQKAKQGVHATNYGCKGRTLSGHLGSTVNEADKFINSWLSAHPGIKRWHERTEANLRTKRSVENKYGFRRYYFDRVDGLLPEALAWIPQSTVAITINKIWKNIYDLHKELVQVLLQVHDSLAGQFLTTHSEEAIRAIKSCTNIVIPYDDPLTIPTGIKTSTISWGACE